MPFKNVRCHKCGANFEVDEARASYSCPNCQAIHVGGGPPPAPESPAHVTPPPVAKETAGAPGPGAPAPGDETARQQEAEQYRHQAQLILNALQINVKVYGSNSAWSGAQPADVDLALRYIDRSLEHYPDNPIYLNLKGLLLIEGKGIREEGLALLERAHQLNPRDITIEDNLRKLRVSPQCFIATAAYGSTDAWQICALRRWRDEVLLSSIAGRAAVTLYYRISPRAADAIRNRKALRALVRILLFPLTRALARRYRRGEYAGNGSSFPPSPAQTDGVHADLYPVDRRRAARLRTADSVAEMLR